MKLLNLCLHDPTSESNMFYIIVFQPTDSADVCVFELHNEARWKSMSEEAIGSVCGPKLLVRF